MTDSVSRRPLRPPPVTGLAARLPDGVLRELLRESRPAAFRAGDVIYRPGEDSRVWLIHEGLVRLYVTALDGREATVSYLGPGDFAGLLTLGEERTSANIQAVKATVAAELQKRRVEEVARADPRFAWELEKELLRRWHEALFGLGFNTFGSTRARIVRHLLSLADRDNPEGRLVSRITQQGLADSAGTVREVAGRVLRDLQDEGLVDLRRGEVLIEDQASLFSELGDVGLPAKA